LNIIKRKRECQKKAFSPTDVCIIILTFFLCTTKMLVFIDLNIQIESDQNLTGWIWIFALRKSWEKSIEFSV